MDLFGAISPLYTETKEIIIATQYTVQYEIIL